MTALPHAWARAHRVVVTADEPLGDGADPGLRVEGGGVRVADLPAATAEANGNASDGAPISGAVLVLSPRTPGWALAEARRRTGVQAWREVADEEMDALLAATYAETGSAADVVGAAESEVDLERLLQDLPAITDLLDAQDDAPVIRMINALLTQAARDGASDVHFEAFETHSVVRYRVDGTLRDVVSPRKALHAALISRIKIMSQLDIAEKRIPQDGRITLRVGGRPIDVRVSTVPTVHGERAVLRLLEKDAGRLRLDRLGLAPDTMAALTRLIRQPHGIVLVTGPTGSGKTTTLYAALGQLDKSVTNILSVEDPVEYDLPGVNQIPVHAKIGMSFGAALRAALRQDPDNIMIGEIRDLETAQIAVQSSLTGHGVLASLHTNDAVSAVTRLTDMGIEPFLLSSSLLGVVAQRLVRCLCPHCKRERPQPDGAVHGEPVGCAQCNHTGFKGRTGIHELFIVDDEVRRIIHDGGNEHALREAARRRGMRSMREDGRRWVDAGITTPDEILRVTRDDE
ncbi:MAG: type II secretion system ATPase GspE [Mitsuaria chitosanitabida]|uniref:type II secretion system ATPase GspE n=1 Tax=Roseateles chitosanitabidus TaxID=65048 RepID=UPI001B08D9C2|nr:type II secretion system ATPase GspE [Roseateles chitosanitabidus]MBO9685294.1 type II secretion system ATPase GspE [Roseateles chitosanitabidus]